MKKFILAFASFTATAIAVSGQTATPVNVNSEVYETIMRSKEANRSNGIFDPNKVQIGQCLTFHFRDGFDTSYTVKKGDTQWDVIKQMLNTTAKDHQGVVQYPAQDGGEDLKPIVIETPIKIDSREWWQTDEAVVALGFLALMVGIIALYLIQRNRRKDPATSGPAMRPGGINRTNVHDVMQQSAARQFQSSNIRILRIEEGILNSNGHAVAIDYADHSRKRVLLNEPGFRATCVVGNGWTNQYVYTLLRCGNDVRMGMGATSKHIVFTPLTTNADVPNPADAPPAEPVVEAPVEIKEEGDIVSTPNFKELVDGLPAIIGQVNTSKNGIQIVFKNGSVNLTCTIKPEEAVKKDA